MSCPTCGPPPPLACPQCGPPVYPPRDVYINETICLRSFGFLPSTMKTRWELIPVVAITGIALGWAVYNICHCFKAKNDVRFIKGHGPKLAPWEMTRPTQKLKHYIVNPKLYKPIPELEELKREIGSYKC